jgi:hypothetical protein
MVATLEELRERCYVTSPLMLACSFRYPKNCVIYQVADETMRKRGWTTGLLLQHEMGHCNGWGSDHAGERPIPWPSGQFKISWGGFGASLRRVSVS